MCFSLKQKKDSIEKGHCTFIHLNLINLFYRCLNAAREINDSEDRKGNLVGREREREWLHSAFEKDRTGRRCRRCSILPEEVAAVSTRIVTIPSPTVPAETKVDAEVGKAHHMRVTWSRQFRSRRFPGPVISTTPQPHPYP